MLPLIDESNEEQMQIFVSKKIEERRQLMSAYNPDISHFRSTEDDLDIDADEDAIVADPYFASLLNRDREILVDNRVYRYSEKASFILQ